jgi:hypothetical protein
MTRDELIEVGAQALAARLNKAYGMDPTPDHHDIADATALLDAVEPLIRADERCNCSAIKERDYLRAKVQALPHWGPEEFVVEEWVKRADVLALLDGNSE